MLLDVQIPDFRSSLGDFCHNPGIVQPPPYVTCSGSAVMVTINSSSQETPYSYPKEVGINPLI